MPAPFKAIPMTSNDVRRTSTLLLSHLDPFTIRFLLAGASIIWSILLFWPVSTFHRHGFEYLRWLFPEEVWGALFLLHGTAVFWRLLEAKSRPVWALVVNCYGFFLWTFTTASINIALGALTPGTGMEWMMVGASFFALVKTGLKREVVTL